MFQITEGTVEDYHDIIEEYNKGNITKEEYIKQLEERNNKLKLKPKTIEHLESLLV